MNDVTFKDFQPIYTWVLDKDGPKWDQSEEEPKFLIDESTKRKYFNETKGCVSKKCYLLTLGTPFNHLALVIGQIFSLITFSHFRDEKFDETSYSYKGRIIDAGKDLLTHLTHGE